jgi:hypothetical protein
MANDRRWKKNQKKKAKVETEAKAKTDDAIQGERSL